MPSGRGDMPATYIELDDAAAHLPELVAEVGRGEEVIITQGDRPVAKLVGYPQQAGRRQLGTARGLITIAEDFDEPLADFAEYIP
jgi:prevent-host-death family protein